MTVQLNEDLRELEQRVAEFRQEERAQYPWQNAASYDREKLRYILTRLAFWSGLFTAFAHRSQGHQQAGQYLFPFKLLEVTSEIDRLTAYFVKVDAGLAQAPRVQQNTAPAAQNAAPLKKKLTPKEDADLYCRRIQEEIRTNQNKSTNLMILRNRGLSQGKMPFVEEEPAAGICGAIHMSCGHATVHGRCNKKMAHGIEFTDCLHNCRMCGQTFTG